MIKKPKVILLISVVLIVFSSVLILSNQNRPVDKNSKEEIIFTVKPGDSEQQVIQNLFDTNLIRSYQKALDYSQEHQFTYYANSYVLKKSMKTSEILDTIANPVSNMTAKKLVIYEGSNVVDVAKQIEEITEGQITEKELISLWRDKNYLNELIATYGFLTDEILNEDILYPLEGYLAAATYSLAPNISPQEVTQMILDATDLMYKDYQTSNAPADYTLHQMLTLASIIERETQTTKDKYLVSGVFYNRIEQGMPLQSDITVLYALQEHKELVTFKDLEVDSPYNTYLHNGLPPGPIASPSIESLDAAFYPQDNDYIYFYALQETGEVLYSKTYEEHLKIIEENPWE